MTIRTPYRFKLRADPGRRRKEVHDPQVIMGERREKAGKSRQARESKSEGNVETSIKLPALWIVFNLRTIKKTQPRGLYTQ